jgi:hypothetical protein
LVGVGTIVVKGVVVADVVGVLETDVELVVVAETLEENSVIGLEGSGIAHDATSIATKTMIMTRDTSP